MKDKKNLSLFLVALIILASITDVHSQLYGRGGSGGGRRSRLGGLLRGAVGLGLLHTMLRRGGPFGNGGGNQMSGGYGGMQGMQGMQVPEINIYQVNPVSEYNGGYGANGGYQGNAVYDNNGGYGGSYGINGVNGGFGQYDGGYPMNQGMVYVQ